jgi:dihydroorotate dehydrogenase electron transfer subunit
MQIQNVKILKKIRLSENEWRYDFYAPDICREAHPGQFIMVSCSQGTDLFLRRPISIHNCRENVLSLMFLVVGEGTRRLAALQEGDQVDLMGPLGHGFDLDIEHAHVTLVGGGVGKAPLAWLADALLARGNDVTLIIGGRGKAQLHGLERFENTARVRVCYATEDGSLGRKGFVNAWFDDDFATDRIYSCGPTPMMRVVKDFAQSRDIPCQLSLEERMGCGIGVCLGCTVKPADPAAVHYLKVCKDGPVFWAQEVDLS